MKNKLIVTALILVATMCVSLMSGCWVDSARIKFTEEPAKTYYVGDSIGDFVLYDMDEKKEYRYSEYQSQITISGFNTEVPGTFVATITMGDYSLEWSYEVIASDAEFAGGSGTVTDPYLVANYVQFNNMLAKVNTAKVYYKLANDIDFAGHAVECKSNTYNKYTNEKGASKEGKYYFNGVVDGNGYKVMNICDINDGAPKMNELFGVVGVDFALKNIEFNFAAEGAKACTGLTTCVYDKATGGNITFDNVKVTGYIDLAERQATSVGAYMAQVDRNTNEGLNTYTITNCVNELNIYNGYTCTFVSAYVNTQKISKITLTNNSYKGDLEGGYAYTAVFAGVGNNGNAKTCAITASGNTIDQANSTVVYFNKTADHGAFANANSSTGKKYEDSAVVALNTAFGALTCVKELEYGAIVKGAAATHTITGIPSEVKDIQVVYSTSYIEGGVMSSGVLNIVEEYEDVALTEGKFEFLAPSIILQNGTGADGLVTPGMSATTNAGVKTVYINRPDAAKGGALKVLAIGFNAEGQAIWTSSALVEINSYVNA